MPRPEPIILHVAAVCAQEDCGANIPAGEKAYWYTKSQKAYCFGGHKGSQQASPTGPTPPPDFPPPATPEEMLGDTPVWSFEQKDKSILAQTCLKAAAIQWVESLRAAVELYKMAETKPSAEELNAYAAAIMGRKLPPIAEVLRAWCLEALD